MQPVCILIYGTYIATTSVVEVVYCNYLLHLSNVINESGGLGVSTSKILTPQLEQ